MICRATGPDWKTGELLPECTMPHGHRGECENKTRLFTDDQLRAECERRFGNEYGARDKQWEKLIDEARPGIHYVAMSDVERRESGLRAERDEWKRRADVAEAHLADPRRVIHIKTDDCEHVPLGSVHDCGRLTFVVVKRDGKRLPMFDLFVSGREREGAGIAAQRPDNELWGPTDEDRLCDDA
jgi:hypothetical protein